MPEIFTHALIALRLLLRLPIAVLELLLPATASGLTRRVRVVALAVARRAARKVPRRFVLWIDDLAVVLLRPLAHAATEPRATFLARSAALFGRFALPFGPREHIVVIVVVAIVNRKVVAQAPPGRESLAVAFGVRARRRVHLLRVLLKVGPGPELAFFGGAVGTIWMEARVARDCGFKVAMSTVRGPSDEIA